MAVFDYLRRCIPIWRDKTVSAQYRFPELGVRG